jgi:hypothetical protein
MSLARDDIIEDSIYRIMFTTNDKNGGRVAPSSALDTNDVFIYKDDSDTEKTSANGITMTSPKDSKTGVHFLKIDTSNDTGDSGFWEAGHEYTVLIYPNETVDSESVARVIGRFRIMFTHELIPRYNGGVHYSSSGGSGEVVGLNGVPSLPLSIAANVLTISDSVGIDIIRIENTFTVSAAISNKIFERWNESGLFAGAAIYDLTDCVIRDIELSGAELGDGSTGLILERVRVPSGANLQSGRFVNCIFDGGTIQGQVTANKIELIDCRAEDESQVILDATNGAIYNVRGFKGDLLLSNYTTDSQIMTIHLNGGYLEIDSSCTPSVGSTLRISGYGKILDNSGANLSVDTTRFLNVENVSDILNDTENTLPATLSTIESKIDTVDGLVDTIEASTSGTIPAAITTNLVAIGTVDTVVDAIKTQTDQMNFTGSNLDVNVEAIDTDANMATRLKQALSGQIYGKVNATPSNGNTLIIKDLTNTSANMNNVDLIKNRVLIFISGVCQGQAIGITDQSASASAPWTLTTTTIVNFANISADDEFVII